LVWIILFTIDLFRHQQAKRPISTEAQSSGNFGLCWEASGAKDFGNWKSDGVCFGRLGRQNLQRHRLLFERIESTHTQFENRIQLYAVLTPGTFEFLLRACLGIGDNFVGHDGERKSLSVERTFRSCHDREAQIEKLKELVTMLEHECTQADTKVPQLWLIDVFPQGKTLTLKLKTADFEVKTRSKTLNHFMGATKTFLSVALPVN
jgi:hypothetical protein